MAVSPRDLRSPDFRARLAEAVAVVEDTSSVELVVLVAPRSGSYPEASWMSGLIALVAVFAVCMFHDEELGDYTLFLGPLLAFVLGFLVPLLAPRLRPLLAARASIERQVELVARASFQKAGLHATRDATALLIYISVLERAVRIVADRGVTASVPTAWLDDTEAQLRAALGSQDAAGALLRITRGLAPELARHLPRRPDDMNELPEVIDVSF